MFKNFARTMVCISLVVAIMSPSASLHTSKHRRALLAILVAALVALGIAIGPGTAHASTADLFIPAQPGLGAGTCSAGGWGGIIWCGTGIGVTFPNGTQEVFGIGAGGGAGEDAMWTVWGTEAHASGWKSLGGICNPFFVTGLSNNLNYSLTIYCVGSNGDWWSRTRSSGVSGGWGAWQDAGVFLPSGILFSECAGDPLARTARQRMRSRAAAGWHCQRSRTVPPVRRARSRPTGVLGELQF